LTGTNRFVVALAAILIGIGAFAPATLAADVTDIGFVDQAALASIPPFTSANRQFAHEMKGVHDPNLQARIAQEFQNKLAERQRQVFGPLFQRAQVAIASVASSKNLSVIVDKRIMIYGGQDVTASVLDLLSGPGDPIPPVNTPPPSSVGYVDQSQIDAPTSKPRRRRSSRPRRATRTARRSSRITSRRSPISKNRKSGRWSIRRVTRLRTSRRNADCCS
jgi:outer membrane protein